MAFSCPSVVLGRLKKKKKVKKREEGKEEEREDGENHGLADIRVCV